MRHETRCRDCAAVVILAVACPLWADTSAGLAAFKKGDYATALKEWKAGGAERASRKRSTTWVYFTPRDLGVERDLDVAQQWYEAAALQGNSQAEFSLGQMYAQGWGIPPDEAQAVRWMEMANRPNTR